MVAPAHLPATSGLRFSELDQILLAMSHVDFELDVNEAAGILRAYVQARKAGAEFCPLANALMSVIRRQIVETIEALEDETDSDDDEDNGDDDDLRMEARHG